MCTPEYIAFVCEQLRPLGEVKARKMMGDYVIYVNEKCVLTACDNTCYIQIHPAIHTLMANTETGIPYEGAKPRYILEIEEQNRVCTIVQTLWNALPLPKKKK